ncbi:unnamed protein product [Porites lobata]|uniref:Endonuclease/exonuclease/phosphatase domain-containing protein n=1 Tax=Porites lobata TaxID=104759 RepID=A0ABN8RCH9_9CNID|nr:unnamed protein product [Porites lobata]
MEVYQRRGNLRFFGIKEEADTEEDAREVLVGFLKTELGMENADQIEFQRVHRVGKRVSSNGKPRQITARFLKYPQREEVMSNAGKLRGKNWTFHKSKYVTMKLNLNFKLLSLNVRGIRSIEKRKAIFNWLVKSKSDIRFLQETYSTSEVELAWKSQWRGDVLFSYGSEHSRGVMILVKRKREF